MFNYYEDDMGTESHCAYIVYPAHCSSVIILRSVYPTQWYIVYELCYSVSGYCKGFSMGCTLAAVIIRWYSDQQFNNSDSQYILNSDGLQVTIKQCSNTTYA